MIILFDNVIKDAQHIYDYGELELEDLERMRGIIDVLETLKKEKEELRKALGEVLETFQIHERYAKISDHQGNKHYLDDEDFKKIKKSWELLNP